MRLTSTAGPPAVQAARRQRCGCCAHWPWNMAAEHDHARRAGR